MPRLVALDLGCGSVPKNPFNCDIVYGIDVNDTLLSSTIRIADLVVDPIPFEDWSFDVITAFDFIEHVPRVIYNPRRRNPFISLMNEVSRVLKPGGVFFSSTPAYPHPSAFQDPTHVNIITEKTFINYFSASHSCHGRMYGYNGDLEFLGQFRRNDSHLVVTMRKQASGEDSSLFSDNDFLSRFENKTGALKLV